MSKKKKYTPDVLMVGALAFAGSTVTQQALIMPKTELQITENFKIPVQGILPFSQKYIANISQKALNEMLPLYMSTVTGVCEKLHIQEEFKKGVIWFVYDFMSKYSLNTLTSFLLKRFNFVDKEKYKDVLREFIQKLITEKSDRDALIQSATTEVVHILRVLTEGTLASMIFNDRFAEAASGTIAAAIDRFLDNEAASRLTDYLFKMISNLEDVTLSNFLENMLGLGPADLANFLDNAYDTVLGPAMVDTVRAMRFGDIAYDLITSVDYDEIYQYMQNSMNEDLWKLNLSGAMTAMSFYAGAKSLARKVHKRREKRETFRKGLRTFFSSDEFIEGDDE